MQPSRKQGDDRAGARNLIRRYLNTPVTHVTSVRRRVTSHYEKIQMKKDESRTSVSTRDNSTISFILVTENVGLLLCIKIIILI